MMEKFYELFGWYEDRVIKDEEDIKNYLKDFEELEKFLGNKIIDLCCGTGIHAIALASIGKEVIGYDISKKAIEIAEKTAKEFKVNAKFFVKDIGKLEEIEADTVIMMGNSIPHFTYKEFYEILKKIKAKYFIIEYHDLLEIFYRFGFSKGDFWEENGELFFTKFDYDDGGNIFKIIKVKDGKVFAEKIKTYIYTTKIVENLFEIAGWNLVKRKKKKIASYIDVYEKT